ncbi:MAG: hypothetical protein JSV22_00480 [Bacteroidales bacterium]|nr:MAG: hypothetical protein JSV22_00480 [Bacteroidales bacterium]
MKFVTICAINQNMSIPGDKVKLLIVLFALCVFFSDCRRKSSKHLTLFAPENNNIKYTGRIDFKNPQRPRLAGAGSYFKFKFRGSSCNVFLKDQNLYDNFNYFSIAVDGKYLGRIRLKKNKTKYQVVKNLRDTVHTLLVCKATEAQNGYVEFLGILCSEIMPLEKTDMRKIEFIGNSITCGMGLDMSDLQCDSGEWFDQHNAYLAYGPVVARELNANWFLSSVSGIGITRFWNSPGPTMPEVYYNTYLSTDTSSLWDINTYIPDLVSICLGTNDFSDGDGSYERPELDSAEFVSAYIRFVGSIRDQYPYAQICCLTSPMLEGEKNIRLKNYLSAVITYMQDVKNDNMIQMFSFSRSYVSGCDYHPDKEDHRKMAEELLPFFKQIMKWK